MPPMSPRALALVTQQGNSRVCRSDAERVQMVWPSSWMRYCLLRICRALQRAGNVRHWKPHTAPVACLTGVFLFPLLQTLAGLARHGCCSRPGSPCSASPSPWDCPSRPSLRVADRLNPESVDSIAVVYINSHADPRRELRTELPDMRAPDAGRSLPPKGTDRRVGARLSGRRPTAHQSRFAPIDSRPRCIFQPVA